MAKPIRVQELYYPMIQFLLIMIMYTNPKPAGLRYKAALCASMRGTL